MSDPDPAAERGLAEAMKSVPGMGWIFAGARLAMLVGVLSLLAAAFTLLIVGGVSTYRAIVAIADPSVTDLENRIVFLSSIKLLDLVLLATILQVVAIGLYALFLDSDIPVPRWLRAEGVDGLKNKLAGIVAIMLGVLFLEQVIMSGGTADLLPMGLGIAAVIVALSFFIRSHPGGD